MLREEIKYLGVQKHIWMQLQQLQAVISVLKGLSYMTLTAQAKFETSRFFTLANTTSAAQLSP